MDTSKDRLDDLHRHREFHAGQLNAWNMAGCIAVIAFGGAAIFSDSIAKAVPYLKSGYTKYPLLAAVGLLVVATVWHWMYHASRIREFDRIMNLEYATGASPRTRSEGLSGTLVSPYTVVAVGVLALLIAIGLAYQTAAQGSPGVPQQSKGQCNAADGPHVPSTRCATDVLP